MINKALTEFIKRLKYASHILPLLDEEEIPVSFVTTDFGEKVSLFISKADIKSEVNNDGQALVIEGDRPPLIELLEGRTRLQILINRGELSFKGSYRHLLKLESLLYICSYELEKTTT